METDDYNILWNMLQRIAWTEGLRKQAISACLAPLPVPSFRFTPKLLTFDNLKEKSKKGPKTKLMWSRPQVEVVAR